MSRCETAVLPKSLICCKVAMSSSRKILTQLSDWAKIWSWWILWTHFFIFCSSFAFSNANLSSTIADEISGFLQYHHESNVKIIEKSSVLIDMLDGCIILLEIEVHLTSWLEKLALEVFRGLTYKSSRNWQTHWWDCKDIREFEEKELTGNWFRRESWKVVVLVHLFANYSH